MGRTRRRCARRAGAPVARMCVSVRESALVWHVALTHITVGSARAPAAEGHGRVPFACHWRATSSFRRASARASAGAGGGAAAAAGGASRGEETECAVRRRCVARRPRACRQRPGLRATRPDGISAAPSQRVRATSPALGAAAPPHTRLCRGHRTQPARRAAPRLLLIPPPRSVEERHPMGSFWRMHPAPPRRERTRAPQTRGAPKTPRKSQRVCLGASPPQRARCLAARAAGGATGCVIWGLYPPPRPTEKEPPRAAVRRPPLAQDVPWWRLFSPRLTEPARRPCRRARAGLGTGKPPWLRQRAPQGDRYEFLSDSLRDLKLNTVCEEAKCPNVGGTPLAQRAAQETKRPRPPRRGWGGWWLKEPPAPHSNVKRTPRPLLGARC